MTLRLFAKLAPWALLILFCVRGVLAMRADGTTADEPIHLAYGMRGLTEGTFARGDETLNSKMPVSVLNAIPVALASRGRTLPWDRQLFLARLASLLMGAVLGWAVWRWALALFGPWSGVVALLAYTFCPNVLAHAHLVTTDIATALGMFAATWCLWRYGVVPSWHRLLVAAAVFGLALLTKATALFLVPIFALIYVVRLLRRLRWRRRQRTHRSQTPGDDRPGPDAPGGAGRAGRAAARLAVFGGVALLVLDLGFGGEGTFMPLRRHRFVSPPFQTLANVPGLADLPLPLPYPYLQGLDMVWRDAGAKSWSYLRGRYSESGFRSYFAWAFLVKVPLATQALLLGALWLALSGRRRAAGAEEHLAVPVVVLAAYLSFGLRLDIGFRYLLPALPFLFVFLARIAAPRAAEERPPGAARWQPAAAGALLLWLGVSSWWIHPHYLAYFNELAGGPRHGARWLIDSNLDWGQDGDSVRRVFAPASTVPVLFDPSAPVAGRVAVSVSNLIGYDPESARRHAWLRDNFRPIATIGYSWEVFDVSEAALARCCAGLPRAWVIDRPGDDLALSGTPFAGGDGVEVRFQEKLNDGLLGANEPVDAARSAPPRPRPVRAWFGIAWPAPRTIGRVAAFPGFASRGPLVRRFLALDYVFQAWDGTRWRDIPGTRVHDNRNPGVEHRFPPLVTSRIRLLVERERNERGEAADSGSFRAACLELAAYRE